jgi:hypothetical protein
VDPKLLKTWCFLKPHSGLQLSPAVRADHVGVGALFGFPSVPSLRVLLSFLKQCFRYMRSVVGLRCKCPENTHTSNTPPYPTFRDVFNSHADLRSLLADHSGERTIWSHGDPSGTQSTILFRRSATSGPSSQWCRWLCCEPASM